MFIIVKILFTPYQEKYEKSFNYIYGFYLKTLLNSCILDFI